MAVYKCPIHGSWLDPEREEACSACRKAGGKAARQAAQRHRLAERGERTPGPLRRRVSFMLKVLLLLSGAAALGLPAVQSLLREQGLEEVADGAEQVSGQVGAMAEKVGDGAREAAQKLGVTQGEQAPQQSGRAEPPGFERAAQRVAMLTAHGSGHTGIAWLPPRGSDEARPLLVWLHAAGDDGAEGLDRMAKLAARYRFAVLAPKSLRGATTPDRFESWQPGDGALLGDDEQHILDSVAELREASHFRVDPAHVLLLGVAGGALTALHLATRDARFSHVALVHDAPSAETLGPLRPAGYLAAGTQDRIRPESRILAAYERLRAQPWDLQLALTKAAHGVADEELESIVHWWLAAP